MPLGSSEYVSVQNALILLLIAVLGLATVSVGFAAAFIRSRTERLKANKTYDKNLQDAKSTAQVEAIKQSERQRDLDQQNMSLVQQQLQLVTDEVKTMRVREAQRDVLVNNLSNTSGSLEAMNKSFSEITAFVHQNVDALREISEFNHLHQTAIQTIASDLTPDGVTRRFESVKHDVVNEVKANSVDIGDKVIQTIRGELFELRRLIDDLRKDISTASTVDREKSQQFQDWQMAVRDKLDHVIEIIALNTPVPSSIVIAPPAKPDDPQPIRNENHDNS